MNQNENMSAQAAEDSWDDIDLFSEPDEEQEATADGLENAHRDKKDEESASASEPAETVQSETELQEAPKGPALSMPIARIRQALDFEQLMRTNPVLAASRVPDGIMTKLRAGMSLREAYGSAENERLRAENRALRQEKANAQRVVGSASTSGRRTTDIFDEAWYDGT